MKGMEPKEGWSDTILKNQGKTHYYRDGTSLCGKKTVTRHHRVFTIRDGSKYFYDCQMCIKKLKE